MGCGRKRFFLIAYVNHFVEFCLSNSEIGEIDRGRNCFE